MKRRIFSRARCIDLLQRRAFTDGDDISSSDGREVEFALMCHMLADGKTVKVYEDRDMGGTVVEYVEE